MTHAAHSPFNSSLLAARVSQAAEPAPLLILTTGLARGDDAAWAQFHRDFGPRIFRQLLAATRGDHDLASEALQQTYLRIAGHARPCELEPVFLAWLRIVARTALSDCRRRRASFWQLLRRRHAEPPLDAEAADDRLQQALDKALFAIEPESRALLEAKYVAGTAVRALALRFSVSPKAIESRLTRARAELRRHILAVLARHE